MGRRGKSRGRSSVKHYERAANLTTEIEIATAQSRPAKAKASKGKAAKRI